MEIESINHDLDDVFEPPRLFRRGWHLFACLRQAICGRQVAVVRLVLIWMLFYAPSSVGAQGEVTATTEDDAEIMRQVRENLPQIPLLIKGRLRSGHLRGGFENTFPVEIRLDLGAHPMKADYTLRDRFGAILERMLVLRYGPAEIDLRYTRGADGEAVSPPPPDEFVQDTYITWDDLTLAFLWWPVTRRIGRDTFRGRDCLVLELTPEDAASADETRRLWVDEKMSVFLQMEVWRDGKPVRRLMARSFRKIGEHWMIKDMEMRYLDISRRTLLRVDDMFEL